MRIERIRIVFPRGKVHLSERHGLWTLCGRYILSTRRTTLAEVTCKHCLRKASNDLPTK